MDRVRGASGGESSSGEISEESSGEGETEESDYSVDIRD